MSVQQGSLQWPLSQTPERQSPPPLQMTPGSPSPRLIRPSVDAATQKSPPPTDGAQQTKSLSGSPLLDAQQGREQMDGPVPPNSVGSRQKSVMSQSSSCVQREPSGRRRGLTADADVLDAALMLGARGRTERALVVAVDADELAVDDERATRAAEEDEDEPADTHQNVTSARGAGLGAGPPKKRGPAGTVCFPASGSGARDGRPTTER